MEISTTKSKPCWYKDAKWIFGLLFTISIAVTFLCYNLVQITAEKPAVDAISMALALSLSQNGLDDQKDINQLLKSLPKNYNQNIKPIPGLNISFSPSDIKNLSPRELRLSLARQFAEPIYQNGAAGLSALATTPEMKKNIESGVGPLGLITQSTHQAIKRIFNILAIISLFLLIPFIFFSHRFGRLASPGIAIIIVSLPTTAILWILNTASQHPRPTFPDPAGGLPAMAGYLAAYILPPIVNLVLHNYSIFLTIGLLLIIVSILGKIIWKLIHKFSNKKDLF